MPYSIIEVKSTNGNKISGSYRAHGLNKEPKTLAAAIELAKSWEKHNRNLKEFAVVKSVLKMKPLAPVGDTNYTDLVRLDEPRGVVKHKPISFKGKLRCVFTDPPKAAGEYHIAILDDENGESSKIKYFSRSIRHDGKRWQMESDNYVCESLKAYWLDIAG